jgi:GNAT superfamily N-acetyltransferase
MHYRFATTADVPMLAWLNKQLVEDEGHRNQSMTVSALERRMQQFLAGDYVAVLFEEGARIVAYALYRDDPEQNDTLYLRQFFVSRDRRRQGVGKEALRILRQEIWPSDKRVRVGVLWHNQSGRAFWQATGFKPHALELELPPRAGED